MAERCSRSTLRSVYPGRCRATQRTPAPPRLVRRVRSVATDPTLLGHDAIGPAPRRSSSGRDHDDAEAGPEAARVAQGHAYGPDHGAYRRQPASAPRRTRRALLPVWGYSFG